MIVSSDSFEGQIKSIYHFVIQGQYGIFALLKRMKMFDIMWVFKKSFCVRIFFSQNKCLDWSYHHNFLSHSYCIVIFICLC